MKRIALLTLLCFAAALAADTSTTIVPPRPRSASLAAADNVRNLVASMRMEAMAARDTQAAIVDDLAGLQSSCETARKSVEALAAMVADRLDSHRTGLQNADAHVQAFTEELAAIDRLISKLETSQPSTVSEAGR